VNDEDLNYLISIMDRMDGDATIQVGPCHFSVEEIWGIAMEAKEYRLHILAQKQNLETEQ
jgi:hypothetical protein